MRKAFQNFLDRTLTNQIEFINMVIDHLTTQDYMAPASSTAPFIDLSPKGVDGLFLPDQFTSSSPLSTKSAITPAA